MYAFPAASFAAPERRAVHPLARDWLTARVDNAQRQRERTCLCLGSGSREKLEREFEREASTVEQPFHG